MITSETSTPEGHAACNEAIVAARAAERERIASAIPPDTLDGLADWMTRIRAEFAGPAAVPDLPGRLKLLADLLRGQS